MPKADSRIVILSGLQAILTLVSAAIQSSTYPAMVRALVQRQVHIDSKETCSVVSARNFGRFEFLGGLKEKTIHEGAQRGTKQCALRENSCFFADNYLSVLALLDFLAIFVPRTLLGVLFPVVIRIDSEDRPLEFISQVGAVSFNTAGAILGSLIVVGDGPLLTNK